MPEDPQSAGPLRLLLDDLPVAALISGYGRLYRGDLASGVLPEAAVPVDICSGWRSDGTMLVSMRATGQMPIPVGPPADNLCPDDDPLAWHDMPPLAAGSMRRQRLVQVTDGRPASVFAMFRDSHADDAGRPTVLHEYWLTAELDLDSFTIHSCRAVPRVLPWPECPAAAASAARLDGVPVDGVRQLVSREFKGTTTCTHLNDLLRSVGDTGHLARLTART